MIILAPKWHMEQTESEPTYLTGAWNNFEKSTNCNRYLILDVTSSESLMEEFKIVLRKLARAEKEEEKAK